MNAMAWKRMLAILLIASGACHAGAALPEGLPAPALHLDAGKGASLEFQDDGSLLQWRDSGSGAGVFVPPGAKPVFVPDAVNGLPAILFEPPAYLVGSSAVARLANDVAGLTVFIVGRSSENGSGTYLRIGSGSTVPALRLMFGRTGRGVRMTARRVDEGELQHLAGEHRVDGTWRIDSGFVDFANSRAGILVNGNEIASSEAFLDGGNTSASDSLMFRIGNDHGSQFWEGEIAEILIFDRLLTSDEHQEVGTYLSVKYEIDYSNSRSTENSNGAPVGYRILPSGLPNDGFVYVDHEPSGRSGHVGQAITECLNGDIIAFYSNVPGDAFGGHGTSGWSEYRISSDGGETWSEPHILEYSMEVWKGGEFHSALVDEVVTAPNGTVVAIAGRYTDHKWGRTTPVYLLSHDNGRTWGPAREVDPDAHVREMAREHASLVYDGTVFVLFNAGTSGEWPGPHTLYVSTDNGETFSRRSILPLDARTWYGAMTVTLEGELIVYSYRTTDEHHLRYTISSDQGHTWSPVKRTFLAKRIRNPQVSERFGSLYFMHGRSGHEGDDPRHLVLYTSENAIDWDEGIFLNRGSTSDLDSYSTNEIIGKHNPDVPEQLLIQSSIAYDRSGRKVNLHHWKIEAP